MGNRYLITEVQLSLLSNPNIEKKRKEKMINDILEKQFVSNSKNHIEEDLEEMLNFLSLTRRL
jgi:hypothetical protein